MRGVSICLLVSLLPCCALADEPRPVADGAPLSGTQKLTLQGDIASHLVDGVDRFLLGELAKSVEQRARHWKRDLSSAEAYERSVENNRKRLAHILGVREKRVSGRIESFRSVIGSEPDYDVERISVQTVRWPAFGDVYGEGLFLSPKGATPGHPMVIAIPDADHSPEQLVGFDSGIPSPSQFARHLAESGCSVLVPTLIDRSMEKRLGRANLTNREFLYRPAFELGRHLIGYEIQKVLAAVDHLSMAGKGSIGVMGYGEGGLVALGAAALDTRIRAVCVSGFINDRRGIWQEPIDRNVFGLLDQFGDAELMSLVAPRPLVVEAAKGPIVKLPSDGGAPAELSTPPVEAVRREVQRARALVAGLTPAPRIELVVSGEGSGPFGSPSALSAFLEILEKGRKLVPETSLTARPGFVDLRKTRQLRQLHELDRHTQQVLLESPYVRQGFMKRFVDQTQGNSPVTQSRYEETAKEYREFFAKEVIGRFDYPLKPMNPRTRLAYEAEKWLGYEVVLDVFPDVMAYGILLLPKDLKPGEKRPVVVCQHGLEGRPQDVIGQQGFAYYKAFAAELANRGYITFAPQNLYIFRDRFRTLQRKANPLGKTLFSVITPQHQQILNFLKSLPHVDKDRLAFYGLSYGGKTAMRVPALLTDYCLSICSADFGEWVCKNASTRSPYSYVWTGEYEIFEFDLGSTFNYAEMAALIAPRPFMVERGHFDGVQSDDTVAYEFAKVRFIYSARLKMPERCEIEFFDGPHTINGKGTFVFLERHLRAAK